MIKIVQCWDDGVVDDIRLCETLRRAGARASFNLNPGLHSAQRSAPWRYRDCKDVIRLSKGELLSTYKGFTIANHSISHPWPTRIPLAQWKTEVFDGRKQLQDFFGQEITGFVYPYGDTNPEVAKIVRDAGHVYARGTGSKTPCFPPVDPLCFTPDCHHAAVDFWTRYENAKAIGSPVFYFWGHAYEFVTEEDWKLYETKLARFNSDPDAVWADLPSLFEANSKSKHSNSQ